MIGSSRSNSSGGSSSSTENSIVSDVVVVRMRVPANDFIIPLRSISCSMEEKKGGEAGREKREEEQEW